MKKWLIVKCLVNYDLVPDYTQYDYEQYLSKNTNQSALIMVKMNINKISKTLN